jgi:hypothetical protein
VDYPQSSHLPDTFVPFPPNRGARILVRFGFSRGLDARQHSSIIFWPRCCIVTVTKQMAPGASEPEKQFVVMKKIDKSDSCFIREGFQWSPANCGNNCHDSRIEHVFAADVAAGLPVTTTKY